MSRFEKKCFIGSAGCHGLLLVAFVFGAAFLPSKRPDTTAGIITFIPSSDLQNAGTPTGSPAPPAPAPAQPEPPAPQPVQPQPIEPEPVKPKEEAVKPREKPEIAKDSEKGPLPKTKPDSKQLTKDNTPPKPAISTKVVKRTNDLARIEQAKLDQAKAAQAKADADYRAKVARYNEQRSKIASDVTGTLAGMGRNLSRSTVVTSIGTDTSGGAVSGRYGDGLKAIYDRNWVLNNDLFDDETVACVSVVVRRDGTVKSATMTKSSGNAAFDRSVRAALKAVQTVQPFPPEMKDAEREFTWKFERKTRIG